MAPLLTFLAQASIPTTSGWSPSVAIVMVACNLFAIAIGYSAIQQTGEGPDMPFPQLASRKKFGLPELLATASFGHILGAGMILGLSSAGVL